MSFKKCLILNRSFKWSVIKTAAADEKILFNSVDSQTGRDNILALANSAHLAVFPFLDWKSDFLLYCLYRKTQTIQGDHVGAIVFRRKSCTWIKDASQLHAQALSSSQNKPPYHVSELKPYTRLYVSPEHTPCCKEGRYKGLHQ